MLIYIIWIGSVWIAKPNPIYKCWAYRPLVLWSLSCLNYAPKYLRVSLSITAPIWWSFSPSKQSVSIAWHLIHPILLSHSVEQTVLPPYIRRIVVRQVADQKFLSNQTGPPTPQCRELVRADDDNACILYAATQLSQTCNLAEMVISPLITPNHGGSNISAATTFSKKVVHAS